MSHIGPFRPGAAPVPPARGGWRFFPHWLAFSFLLVFAINGLMAWDALSTFPGLAVENDFDHSNSYDQVLETARRQAALGWALEARVEEGRPVLTLTGRDGGKLARATLSVTAQRPLGPPSIAHPAFAETAAGIYRADAALDQPGQWDLLVRVTVGGDTLTTTRRIVVR